MPSGRYGSRPLSLAALLSIVPPLAELTCDRLAGIVTPLTSGAGLGPIDMGEDQ